MAFLAQLNVGAEEVIVPLSKAAILIGRDPESNIYLDATEISKNHATIIYSDGSYVLKDNGSTNGSYVNGEKVSNRTLAHGDQIRFGPFEFIIDLLNPGPVGSPVQTANLERGSRSYRTLLEIKPLAGSEDSGHLKVMTDGDTSESEPQTLPAAGFIAHLEKESLKKLSAFGTWMTARNGDTLIHEGKSDGKLFFIISGSLEARVESSPTPIGTITPGEWIGEVGIFDPAGAMCSVVAKDTVTYWVITRSNLEKFINEHKSTGSALLIGLAANLGSRLRASISKTSPVQPQRRLPAIIVSGLSILAAAGFLAAWLSEKDTAMRYRAEYASLFEEFSTDIAKTKRLLAAAEAPKNPAQPTPSPTPKTTQSEEITPPQIPRNNKKPAPQETPIVRQPRNEETKTQRVSAPSPSPSPTETPVTSDLGYPSQIIVTTKTRIPLIVDGAVTGSLTIPMGRELPVLGISGDNLLVDLGESTTEIPRTHTNFQEALAAEAATLKSTPPKSQSHAPTPAVASAKPTHIHQDTRSTPTPGPATGPATFEDIQNIFDSVDLLRDIKQVRDLQNSSQKDINRFIYAQDDKWDRAAENAKELLANPETPEPYRQWLTGIVTAAEMFEPARIKLLEVELQNLDRQWIDLKIKETTRTP